MKLSTLAARLGVLLTLGLLVQVRPASAQTPEGTVITNTASVSFTDANSNSYTPVTASVSVTVGFSAGISLTGAATATPASPSTADTLFFTYTNIGNGNDSLRVTESISVAGVITVTGYRVGSTTYGSLAALNTALSGTLVAQNGTLVVKVVYDVASGKGGTSTAYTLTGFSRRDGTKTQAATTTITPSQSPGVAVTPDGSQNLQHLPSNGTNYTFNFTVQNNGNGPDNFNLVASHPGSAVSIVSVNGTAGSSASISGLAAGASATVPVVYSVLNVAAGTKDTVKLTATSVANNAVTDAGTADLTVIRPSLTMSKQAFRDDQVTSIGAGQVLPGEFIQYKVTITNAGAAPASSVQITDALPAQLSFSSAAGDAAGWTIGNSGNNVTADLSGALASGASRFIWVRVQVQ
jgi:trimeric autotransporter adhesin